MAKKITNTETAVNPITVNALNVNDAEDLTYEIGLGKLIKFVVDGMISEDEINAVFQQVCDTNYDNWIHYFNEEWEEVKAGLKHSECCGCCGCCENCPFRAKESKSANIIKRAWNKVKSWFKK